MRVENIVECIYCPKFLKALPVDICKGLEKSCEFFVEIDDNKLYCKYEDEVACQKKELEDLSGDW